MQTVLMYVIDTLTSKFQNIKDIMKDVIENEKGKWYKLANGYRSELGITWDDLEKLEKPALKKLIKLYDTSEWKNGMAEKVSLKFYIQEKDKIKYDYCYRNNTNSLFLARARTNSIKLEEHKGRGIVGYDKTCKMCKEAEENIVHFLMDCGKLEAHRNYDLIDKDILNPEERMRTLLFRNNRYQETGEMIKNLWIKRRHLLGDNKKKKNDTTRQVITKPQRPTPAQGSNPSQGTDPPQGNTPPQRLTPLQGSNPSQGHTLPQGVTPSQGPNPSQGQLILQLPAPP